MLSLSVSFTDFCFGFVLFPFRQGPIFSLSVFLLLSLLFSPFLCLPMFGAQGTPLLESRATCFITPFYFYVVVSKSKVNTDFYSFRLRACERRGGRFLIYVEHIYVKYEKLQWTKNEQKKKRARGRKKIMERIR